MRQMKRIFLTIMLLAFCSNVFAKKEVSLDSAISAVSAELMKSPKIEKWKKIVLMNFSDNIEIQNYIEEELANKLVHGFTVIDRKNLGILREELEFQNTGKADPNSIKKIGSISGADFVLWGIFEDGELKKELKIQAENIQNGTTSLIHKESIKKDDDVLRNLKKNTTSVNLCISCGITLGQAIEKAISDLTKKILESNKNNVLVYNILADKSELSKDIHGRIGIILSKDKNINLLTNRDELDPLETEMSFQASGEVDAGTIKKRGKLFAAHSVIYGNIRPIGNDYRLFLYAVDIENAKIIAASSQIVQGDKKEIESFVPPNKVASIKVEPLSSDRMRILWEKVPNARNFIVYRDGIVEQKFFTGANGIIDFNLKPETKYCYSVESRNTKGVGEKFVQECATTYGVPKFYEEIKIKDKTKNSVTLIWGKIPGASYYNVERCYEDKCDYVVKNIHDTVYKDDKLQNSTYYRYSIEAVNSAGLDKSKSTQVLTKPIPPINIDVIYVCADKLRLKWEDKQKNIDHYMIERYSTKIHGKEIEVPRLKPETDYEFKIKAINNESESEYSEPLKIRTAGKPKVPDSLKIKIDSSYYSKTVILSWDTVSCADSYYVYRNNEKLRPTTEKSYADNNYNSFEKGIEYAYSVSAVNAAGESEKSNSVSILTRPPKPVITKKDIGDNWFFIEWAPMQNVHKYRIVSYENGREKSDTIITDTFFRKIKLPYSSEYTYHIFAANKAGESDPVEVKIETLGAPQYDPGLKIVPVSKDSIMLKWNSVQDASYVLYLCEKDKFGDDDYKELHKGNDTTYTHTGLKANTEYKYAIVAKNMAGESEKTCESGKTSIVPPANIQIKEFNLDSVKITWQKSDGANYYKIYRDSAEIGNTRSTYYYGDINANKTEWTDKTIEPKKEYSYYVAAVDDKGDEWPSESKKHKTAATGILVLKNENTKFDVIKRYEIKKGSEIITGDVYISAGQDKDIPIVIGKGYSISITNSQGKEKKGDKSFEISEGKKIIFIYKENLRKKQ